MNFFLYQLLSYEENVVQVLKMEEKSALLVPSFVYSQNDYFSLLYTLWLGLLDFVFLSLLYSIKWPPPKKNNLTT